jgi:hypothetical protein
MAKKKSAEKKEPDLVEMSTPDGILIKVPRKKVEVKKAWGWKVVKSSKGK